GLFLDQRENRQFVRQMAQGKKVLNLFSYTSGFSVQSALGGAEKVTTVDVSEKFLNWSRENFKLNNIKDSSHEFFAQDCMVFLKGSVKRNRTWDLIICDPPSFGRSKDSVWKIEKDLPALAELLLQCLSKGGSVLFTCNYEKKNRTEVIKLFCSKLQKNKFEISDLPMQSLDYEVTDEHANLLKGFLVTKK
ncbi:MAG: methyltransferase, partial [Pseudobdellovibrio sp.]|nr:methyltransferase [Pseudobdellovibrio sp.]